MANIRYVNEKGADGEALQVRYDRDGTRNVIATKETAKSRIKKAQLLTIEDVRTLLLEIFK